MQREEVFQTYKPLLFSIAYNMLGSVMDAEDCVQETFLRWYTASDNDEKEAIRSPKAYLSTIVTRLCMDHLRSARVQRERYVGVWLPEPLITIDETSVTGMTELAETLSVAFLHLLEQLSPVERAVFLLRQIFDYDYREIAAIVEKSEENCRQIVRRARQHLGTRHALYHASKEQQDNILHQFLLACTHGDMDGLLTLLANDITIYADSNGKVRAARNPIYGPENVARYLLGLLRKMPDGHTIRIGRINGQPGVISYIHALPYAITILDIIEGRIQEIDMVVNPEKLRVIPPLN